MKISKIYFRRLGTIAHYVGVLCEYIIVILIVLWLNDLLMIPKFFSFPVRMVGFGVTFFGIFLIGWCCWLQFTVGHGTTGFSEPTTELVTLGPYAWVRNPMMLGQFLFFLGLGVTLNLGAMFILLPVIILATHVFTLYIEEPALKRRFGQKWIDYMKRVPRWIPRFSKLKK